MYSAAGFLLLACLTGWLAQSKYLCWIFCRGSLKFSEELLSCVAALQGKRQICNFVWRFIADSLRCYYDDDYANSTHDSMNVSDIISRFREQFLLFSIISCHCGYIPTDKQTTGRAAAAASSILLNDRTTTMTSSSSSTVLCTHFRYRHSLCSACTYVKLCTFLISRKALLI